MYNYKKLKSIFNTLQLNNEWDKYFSDNRYSFSVYV